MCSVMYEFVRNLAKIYFHIYFYHCKGEIDELVKVKEKKKEYKRGC